MVVFDPDELCFNGFQFSAARFEGVGNPASKAVEGGCESGVAVEEGMPFVGVPHCCVGDSCRLGKSQ
jgi:hypothetical protein